MRCANEIHGEHVKRKSAIADPFVARGSYAVMQRANACESPVNCAAMDFIPGSGWCLESRISEGGSYEDLLYTFMLLAG